MTNYEINISMCKKCTSHVLDVVNDAIAKKKKISFIYNSYGADFKLHPKREKPYIVNPYQIVANNSHFYLIGNYDKYDDVSHYRLDKMTCVNILNELDKTGTIEVSLHCNEDAMFYWALQYGPYVEIIEPQSLRERIKHAVQEMSKKYAREGKSYE